MRPNPLNQRLKAAPAPSLAIPEAQWPFLVKWIAQRRQPGEIGVGDTVHRLFSQFGGNTLSEAYERLAGRPCGCKDRQAWLNQRYPYGGINDVLKDG